MKRGSLDLGKELSKNSQKQILGGRVLVCQYGTLYNISTTCSGLAAYCPATGRGQFIACYQ